MGILLVGGANIEEQEPEPPNTFLGSTLVQRGMQLETQVLAVKIEEDKVSELIDKLMMCESGGNQNALNPADTDGTPSNGLFQFKRTTWKYYVKKYDMFEWQNFDEADWENTMWSGDLQREVVERMFIDPDVRLRTTEFPDCSKKLGLKQNYAK